MLFEEAKSSYRGSSSPDRADHQKNDSSNLSTGQKLLNTFKTPENKDNKKKELVSNHIAASEIFNQKSEYSSTENFCVIKEIQEEKNLDLSTSVDESKRDSYRTSFHLATNEDDDFANGGNEKPKNKFRIKKQPKNKKDQNSTIFGSLASIQYPSKRNMRSSSFIPISSQNLKVGSSHIIKTVSSPQNSLLPIQHLGNSMIQKSMHDLEKPTGKLRKSVNNMILGKKNIRKTEQQNHPKFVKRSESINGLKTITLTIPSVRIQSKNPFKTPKVF